MAKRPLSAADREAWAAFSRTVRRSGGFDPDPPAPALPPPAPATQPAAKLAPAQPAPPKPNVAPAGLDKASWTRFASNRNRADRKLDLHGHTAAQAHRAVHDFLVLAVAANLRCVEIVTGNGAILVRELPHWLEAPALSRHILALAHPHARNTGALRILLRRRRQPGRVDAATPASPRYGRFI